VYTIADVDLVLRGPLPFAIQRNYNSASRERDVGLGFGWTHSLAWEIEFGRTARIWKDDGNPCRFTPPEDGHHVQQGRLHIARHGNAFVVTDTESRLAYCLEHLAEVQVADHGPDDRGARYVLTAVLDSNGNRISLRYDAGLLVGGTDSAGRQLHVRRGTDRRIAGFEIRSEADGQTACHRTYEYDAHGLLVTARDGYGYAVQYTYANRLLTSVRTAEGMATIFRYDRRDRCIETWVENAGGDPSLDETVPRVLADGRTRAKGVLHCKFEFGSDGYCEMVDSRAVHRNFLRGGLPTKSTLGGGVHDSKYDALGNLVEYLDPKGAKSEWQYDAAGRLLSSTDPLGGVRRHSYDKRGFLTDFVDELGLDIEYHNDPQGRLLETTDTLGPVVAFEYDRRGALTRAVTPDGRPTVLEYDAMGNRTRIVEPNGAARTIRYDGLGQIVSFVDFAGNETRYVYGANGEIVAKNQPDGSTWQYIRDRDGRLTGLAMPEGTCELSWAGYNAAYEVRRPDGTRVLFRYDREGDLVRVINPRGETHRLERDAFGRVVAEHTFDGRVLRYRHDSQGQLTRIEDADGGVTEVAYDLLERIVERKWPDETSEAFEYDAGGRLVSGDNGVVRCTFEYDLRGRMIRETQQFDGETHTVEATFDVMGNRTILRTSEGYVQRTSFTPMGSPAEMALGDATVVRFSRDGADREIRRSLAGGAVLDCTYDTLGQLSSRELSVSPAGLEGPEWVGRRRGLIWAQRLAHPAGSTLLARVDDSLRGTTEFQNDALGQIRSRVTERGDEEVFSYDAAGAILERGVARRYAPGGRIERHGETVYTYDQANRLVEKSCVRADGATDSWRFEWNAQSLLAVAITPDGRRVRNTYDAFARRVEKLVSDRNDKPVVRTRFVWDGDRIVHEIRTQADALPHTPVDERTYAYAGESLTPLAHRDARLNGTRSQSAWVHYVSDAVGRPELLIDDSGGVLTILDDKVWGDVQPLHRQFRASTPARFVGHWADEETGLFYNRYRHYDPETGLYLSPEPLGLQGGLSPFGYATNRPFDRFDVDGLMTANTIPPTPGVTGQSGSSGQNNLHPIVQQALLPLTGSLEPPTYPRADGNNREPRGCAEPKLLSNYLKAYEKGPPPKPLDNPAAIKKALNGFSSQATDDNGNRAPCKNCSQMFCNLMAKYGAPKPKNIGAGARQGGSIGNMTPPKQGQPGYQSYDQALAAYKASQAK
jgi:RHS repeat-associated protein